MPIPDYQEIMLPLLQHTADGQIHTAREFKETLADHFGLTPDERHQMLPSGQQTTFHNRVAWAKTYLSQAGLLETVRRGQFRITERGRTILNSPPERIDSAFLSQFPEFTAFRSRNRSDNGSDEEQPLATDANEQTPEEPFQHAYAQIRDDLASELLAQIMALASGSPVSASGQEIDIVVPAGLEDTEGDSPFQEGTSNFRSQVLYHADEFASLPDSHSNIVALSWRMHSRTPAPVSGAFDDVKIVLSTTCMPALSPDFEINHGEDATVVFDGRREFEGCQVSLERQCSLMSHFSTTRHSGAT